MFELYIFKREYWSLLPQIYVWSWDSNLVCGCWGGSFNSNIWRFLPKLPHPDFLLICHCWNFYGWDVSLELPQSSLLCFTQCDPVAAIIDVASSSSPEVLWFTTLVFLGYPSSLKPKQPKWIAITEIGTNKEIRRNWNHQKSENKGIWKILIETPPGKYWRRRMVSALMLYLYPLA